MIADSFISTITTSNSQRSIARSVTNLYLHIDFLLVKKDILVHCLYKHTLVIAGSIRDHNTCKTALYGSHSNRLLLDSQCCNIGILAESLIFSTTGGDIERSRLAHSHTHRIGIEGEGSLNLGLRFHFRCVFIIATGCKA